MEVRYDESQDITLRLKREEERIILNGPTNHFFDIHMSSKQIGPKTNNYYMLLRGLCNELQAFFFLGYSKDIGKIFRAADILDKGLGKIIIPKQIGDSWKINLSLGGIEHYKGGWPFGIRYPGGSKLFIKGPFIF